MKNLFVSEIGLDSSGINKTLTLLPLVIEIYGVPRLVIDIVAFWLSSKASP